MRNIKTRAFASHQINKILIECVYKMMWRTIRGGKRHDVPRSDLDEFVTNFRATTT